MYYLPGQIARGWKTILLSFLVFAVSFRATAQTNKFEKVSIHLVQQPLPQALRQLGAATGAVFAFDEQQLKHISTSPRDFKDASLSHILDQLLKGTGYTFKQVNGSIVISPALKALKNSNPQAPAVLKGRIVDFETSQPLPGATIALVGKGNDSVPPGKHMMVTDERGFYTFKNIPEGVYALSVTYSGYQKSTVGKVTLTGGKEHSVDVKLQAGSQLNEVVVAGIRKVKAVTHSTERDLISEIRNASGVVSGISNELINKTGDRNAAEVVKRISGVTVVDDRFIVVRGMNERYNITYLNNNVAPSTELYSKAFAYDLLPSSIIDRILVYKSPVADLVADYGGGAIKVFTKNAMPVKHLDIGIQLAHRPGSTLTSINSYNGGKLDFLGFDDGTRKLPRFSPGYFNIENTAVPPSQATMVNGFSNTLNYGTRQSIPDMQLFVNYYNSWKIGQQKRLYNLTSVTYTHETKNYDIYKQTGNTNAYGTSGTEGFNYGDLNKIYDIRQSTEVGKINVLENLRLKINEHNNLELKNFFVNEGRNMVGTTSSRVNAYAKLDTALELRRSRDIVLSFQQRLLYSNNIGGQHSWGKTHAQELEWGLGYTYDLQHVPDQRISHFASSFGQPYMAVGVLASNSSAVRGMIERVFIKNEEQVYNASADYTFHPSKSLALKAGTYQMYKLRHVGRRFYRVNRGGLRPDEVSRENDPVGYGNGLGHNNPTLLQFPQQQLSTIWNTNNFPDNNSGLKIYDATQPTDSYVASEQNNAFYLMGDWKTAGEKITVNAGIRMEYDRQKAASATRDVSDAVTVAYANHPMTSWLPSVNVSWRPNSTIVMRTGYGRTVNRPEFREISAYVDYDYQTNEYISGDPAIVSALIDNFDFRAEWYPKSAGNNEMFNAGVFYKFLRNPIERLRKELTTTADNGNLTAITFANAESAKVYGVELEIKKSLSFLGRAKVFKDLSLLVNGAWIKSSTVQVVHAGGANRDTVPGRPLQGQSPYVLNAGVFYENPGWGTKIGMVYNVNGPRIYAKSVWNVDSKKQANTKDSAYVRPDLVQMPFHQLDLSITQRIIKSLQVKFTIQNLLDQEVRLFEDHNFNQRYDPEQPRPDLNRIDVYYTGDNIYSRYKPGRYFLLQFTYAF